jgi:hypothetical protein
MRRSHAITACGLALAAELAVPAAAQASIWPSSATPGQASALAVRPAAPPPKSGILLDQGNGKVGIISDPAASAAPLSFIRSEGAIKPALDSPILTRTLTASLRFRTRKAFSA